MANKKKNNKRTRSNSGSANQKDAVSPPILPPPSPENQPPAAIAAQETQQKQRKDAVEQPLHIRIKQTAISSISASAPEKETVTHTGNPDAHTSTESGNNTADILVAASTNSDTTRHTASPIGPLPESSLLSILPKRAQISFAISRIGGMNNNCLPRALVSSYDPIISQARRVNGYPMQTDAAARENRMTGELRTQIIDKIRNDQSLHAFIAPDVVKSRVAGNDLNYQQSSEQSPIDAYLHALTQSDTQLGEYEIAAAAQCIDRCIIVYYSNGKQTEELTSHRIHNAPAATRHLPCILMYTTIIRHFDVLVPAPPLRVKLQQLIVTTATTTPPQPLDRTGSIDTTNDEYTDASMESESDGSSSDTITSAIRNPTRHTPQAQRSILIRLTRCPPLVGVNKRSSPEQLQKAAPSPRALEEQIRFDVLHCGAMARNAQEQSSRKHMPNDMFIRESLHTLNNNVTIKVARRGNYPKVCWALVVFANDDDFDRFRSLLDSVGLPYQFANDLRCRGAVLHVGKAAYQGLGRAELDRVLTPFLQQGLHYQLAHSHVGTQLGQIDFVCPTSILPEFAQRMKIDFPHCEIVRYNRNPSILCRRCWRIGHAADQCRMQHRCSCGITRTGSTNTGTRCDHEVRDCILCTNADRKKLPAHKRRHPSYACPHYVKDVVTRINFPPPPMHNRNTSVVSPVSPYTPSAHSSGSSTPSSSSSSSYASAVRNGKRARIDVPSTDDALYPSSSDNSGIEHCSDSRSFRGRNLTMGSSSSDSSTRDQTCDSIRTAVGAVRDRRLSTINNTVASRINAVDSSSHQSDVHQILALHTAQIQALQEQINQLTRSLQPIIQFCTALQSSPALMAAITSPFALALPSANATNTVPVTASAHSAQVHTPTDAQSPITFTPPPINTTSICPTAAVTLVGAPAVITNG